MWPGIVVPLNSIHLGQPRGSEMERYHWSTEAATQPRQNLRPINNYINTFCPGISDEPNLPPIIRTTNLLTTEFPFPADSRLRRPTMR